MRLIDKDINVPCTDTISRQAAIIALSHNKINDDDVDVIIQHDIETIKQLPSAQAEHLTDNDFETIRIHLSAYKEQLCNQPRWKEAEEYQLIIDRFMAFAIAQEEMEGENNG